jgi:hypothetical protein
MVSLGTKASRDVGEPQDNAAGSAGFFGQVSRELKAASGSGRLPFRPLRCSTIADWKDEYFGELLLRFGLNLNN